MPTTATLRWVFGRLAADPAAWLVLVVVTASFPLWVTLAPIGITIQEARPEAAIYEVAFMGALAGAALGTRWIGEAQAWLPQLAHGQRLVAELAAVGACSLGFEALALALPVTSGPRRFGWELAPAALVTALHLSALGVLLARLPLPRVWLPWALVAASWVLPALPPGQGPLALGLERVLGASRHLATVAGGVETPMPGLADMAAVGAILLSAWSWSPAPPRPR